MPKSPFPLSVVLLANIYAHFWVIPFRGKTRARRNIEDYVLSQYALEKSDKNGWQYILTIPYQTQDDLDDTIYDILREARSTADERHCFIEADVIALDGSDRSW